MKEFEKQLRNVKVSEIITTREFISWENTEEGRCKTDRYERISDGRITYYVNCNNRNSAIYHGEFFDLLEEIYHMKKGQ